MKKQPTHRVVGEIASQTYPRKRVSRRFGFVQAFARRSRCLMVGLFARIVVSVRLPTSTRTLENVVLCPVWLSKDKDRFFSLRRLRKETATVPNELSWLIQLPSVAVD